MKSSAFLFCLIPLLASCERHAPDAPAAIRDARDGGEVVAAFRRMEGERRDARALGEGPFGFSSSLSPAGRWRGSRGADTVILALSAKGAYDIRVYGGDGREVSSSAGSATASASGRTTALSGSGTGPVAQWSSHVISPDTMSGSFSTLGNIGLSRMR